MVIRPATIEEITEWWDDEIAKSPEDHSIIVWKSIFVDENINGKRKTFFAFSEQGKVVGQCTLLFESDDKLMTCNGKAEIIKLEVVEEQRGQGISTKLYDAARNYVKCHGIDTLTIGVEPSEVRNMQIYFHWGFANFLQCKTEIFPPVNEYDSGKVVTVLCYSQEI